LKSKYINKTSSRSPTYPLTPGDEKDKTPRSKQITPQNPQSSIFKIKKAHRNKRLEKFTLFNGGLVQSILTLFDRNLAIIDYASSIAISRSKRRALMHIMIAHGEKNNSIQYVQECV
jgi:hypothetical protein